jgi:protein NRD1
MVTAEFGGTGGQNITTGMVVEEPDIEIGAGPSSKGKILPLLREMTNMNSYT